MKNELRGIYPVLPTPFDAQGKIIWRDLESIVDFAIACGVQGVTVNDFFGEFQYMTDEERLEAARTVLKRADGRLQVIVGVSGVSPMKMVDFSRHAEDHGAAAVLCAAPYLTAYGWDVSVKQGFLPLDRQAGIPIVLHNAPDWLSGMAPGQIAALTEKFRNRVYVKDDSQAIHTSLTDTLEAVGGHENFGGVFAGHGAFDMVHEFRRGACGYMLGVHLADQQELIWQAMLAGETGKAEQLQFALARIQIIERLYATEVCKYMLKERGVIQNTGSRLAGKPLFDRAGVEEFKRAYRALNKKVELAG